MLAILGALGAGVLTTLAPCVLPLLPIIVGGSIQSDAEPGKASGPSWLRPLVVAVSLAVSIIAFTLLLKVSTALIGVPPHVWSWISGGILILLGLVNVFPAAWTAVSERLGFGQSSNSALAKARQRGGLGGAIATGAALGPVFSSCSPMYGYVVVTVLPASFGYGMVLLTAYVIGLAGVLMAIALAGRRLIAKLRWAADPNGWFRRGLGIVFILVGVFIMFGLDKELQAWILENSPFALWELDEKFIPAP